MPTTSAFNIADTGRTLDQNRAHIGRLNELPLRYELRHIPGRPPALNAAIDDLLYDVDFENLGTNASTGDITLDAEGGWKAETDGADADSEIILPHLDATGPWTVVTWGTDKEVEWSAYIGAGSNITNTVIWSGLKLTNTPTVATNADQAFFRYEDDVNSGRWQVVYSIGGVDTTVDTGLACAVSTRYHLEIKIDSGRIARFYINGALVATSTALTDAIDLIPYNGVMADGAAAAKHFYYYGQSISRIIG